MPRGIVSLLHYVVWFVPMLLLVLGVINYIGVSYLFLILYIIYIFLLKEEKHLINFSPFMLIILLLLFGLFMYDVTMTYLLIAVIVILLQTFMDITINEVIGLGSFTNVLGAITIVFTFTTLVVLNIKYLRKLFKGRILKKEGE